MNMRRAIGVVMAIQIVILVTIAGLLGLAPGVTAQLAMADSMQHFSLLAETMQPIDSTIGYDNTEAFLTTTQDTSISSQTTYIGQLDLPHGARVTAVRCFGRDTDPSREFYFRLYRYSLWTNPVWSGVTDFAYSGTGFNGGTVVPEAAVYPDMALIDNAEFSYGLFLALPKAQTGELGVLRCVVDATYPVSVPLVQYNWTGP